MTKKILIYCACVLLLAAGCKKKQEVYPPTVSAKNSSLMLRVAEVPENETVMGPQLANPYTPENMTQAAIALQQKGIQLPENLKIRTTHYYVKYMPQNWEQYQLLHDDTNHVFFDYPLDHAIEIQAMKFFLPPATKRRTSRTLFCLIITCLLMFRWAARSGKAGQWP